MKKNKYILLIEDDMDDQFFFRWAVTLIDPLVECIIVKNGEDGINKVKEMNGLPDLVFLDLNIPLMTGFEFLKHIEENKLMPGVPVIIFSVSNKEEDILKAHELGAAGFFRKPKDVKDLLSILKDIFSIDFQKVGSPFIF